MNVMYIHSFNYYKHSSVVVFFKDLAEDNITLDEDIINILRSEKGKTYLSAVRETFPDCSMDLQGRVLACTSHNMQNVQNFLQEVKRNILEEYVQVRMKL